MKRILSLLLTLVLLSACLVSCDGDDADGTTEAHVHQYAPATCLSAKRCSCGATEGEKGGHSFVNCVCNVCEITLLDYLVDLAKNPDTNKIENENLYLKYITESSDSYYVLYARAFADHPTNEDAYYTTELALTQQALLSGIFEWSFYCSTYIEERNQYDVQTISGTVTAAEFTASTSLTVSENNGFTDIEAANFLSRVPTGLDQIITDELIPLLAGNNAGLTVKDLGFDKY
ncbi:MAG: hypothetical protein IJW16_03210 [Clostridia bacterium]|nr:hypothetical protein [Clostridia bacterium]